MWTVTSQFAFLSKCTNCKLVSRSVSQRKRKWEELVGLLDNLLSSTCTGVLHGWAGQLHPPTTKKEAHSVPPSHSCETSVNTSVYLHCEETGQYGIMLKYFACAWPDIPFQTLQSLWTDSQWKVKKTAEIMKGQKVALKMEMIRN